MNDSASGRFVRVGTLWRIIAVAMTLFFIDLVVAVTGVSDSWEREFLVWFQTLRSAPLDRMFWAIAETGGVLRTIPIAVAIVYFLLTHRRLEAIIMLCAPAIAQGSRYAITWIVQRPRPNLPDVTTLPVGLGSGGNPGFPSGHAYGSMVAYGLIAVWLWRAGHRIPAASLVAWIALISTSRVYAGVHYPTDVFASICLGVAFIAATVLVYQHFQSKRQIEQITATGLVSDAPARS